MPSSLSMEEKLKDDLYWSILPSRARNVPLAVVVAVVATDVHLTVPIVVVVVVAAHAVAMAATVVAAATDDVRTKPFLQQKTPWLNYQGFSVY